MKTIVKIIFLVLLPFGGMCQEGVRFTEKFGPFYSAYEQENDFTNRKVISYPFVSEADVMWSKVTWEIIDLREKMNLSLYYPTRPFHQRKSLVTAILDGLKQNFINAYYVSNNAFEFDSVLTYNQVRDLPPLRIVPVTDPDNPANVIRMDTIRWEPKEIVQILIKEVWYISRKDYRLHNEIIGICPIREYEDEGEMKKTRLFWIYYPDVRDYFSRIPVYSSENDKPLYSFDDLFIYRYFHSYFTQEANVYNDRAITSYSKNSSEAQEESERIKKEISDYEQDLWEN